MAAADDKCAHGVPYEHPTLFCRTCMDIAFGRIEMRRFVPKGDIATSLYPPRARRAVGSIVEVTEWYDFDPTQCPCHPNDTRAGHVPELHAIIPESDLEVLADD